MRRIAIRITSLLVIFCMLALSTMGQVSIRTDNGLSVSLNQNEAQAAVVVTLLGTASNKASADPWTAFSSITLATGDVLILCVAYDYTGYGFAASWNSNALTYDIAAHNSGGISVYIERYHSLSEATGDIVIDWSGTLSPVAMAASLYKVTGLDGSPFDKSAIGAGSGTAPTSGATAALFQADELIIGAIGMEEQTDEKGTWTTGAGYVSGNDQDAGTTGAGGASNVSIFGVAEIVAATTAQEAEQTGTLDNDWAAAVATYKMASAAADISNAPTGKAFGAVAVSTDYWSNGSAPTWPLDDSESYFTVTNNGSTASITIKATNFTGGVGWTLASSPGENVVTLKAAPSGTDLAVNMTTLTTSEQAFITGLAASGTKKWEIKMETPTSFTDGVLKESTITLTATLD